MTTDPLTALLQQAHAELDRLAPTIRELLRLGKAVRVSIYVTEDRKIKSKVEG